MNGAFLTLDALFSYLEATPSSRCVNEGQAALNAKHIVTCGITSKKSQGDTQIMELFALCLQTSALSDRPHEIKGTLCVNEAVVLIQNQFLCTCKAGNSGKCKHVGAVLILCTRENVLDFPLLSSTDVRCYWTSRSAKEKYAAAPLLEEGCLKKKVSPKKRKILSEVESNEILKTFSKNLPTVAYSLHRIGRRKSVEDTAVESLYPVPISTVKMCQLQTVIKKCDGINVLNILPLPTFSYDCCQKFYYDSLCNVDVTKVATSTEASTEVWHKERQFRITGSRCYQIFTYSLNDWRTKTLKYFWPKSFKNKYTAYGIQQEDAARAAYCKITGHTVLRTGLIVSRKQPWLGYSPDGIIFKDGEPSKLLEIKCPYSGKDASAISFLDSCAFFKTIGGVAQMNRKHMYFAQVQLGMTILNLPECDFVIYSSFDQSYVNVTIKYDQTYSKALVEKLHFNYFNKMLHFKCTLEVDVCK